MCSTGLLIHATLATVGLSALVAAAPAAFVVVKAIGALYLAYISFMTLRSASKPLAEQPRQKNVFLRGCCAIC